MVSDDELARFRSVICKLPRQLNVSAAHEGLTPTQASVLSLISRQGPIGLAEVIEIEALNPTMLSRVVGKLTAEGLVSRLQDPDDLRSVRLEATEAGRATHERIRDARRIAVAECFTRLSPEHEEALLAALPALETLAQQQVSTKV